MHKKCSVCGLEKPHNEFHVKRSNKDGLNVRCKACQSAYFKKYYSIPKNKTKINTKSDSPSTDFNGTVNTSEYVNNYQLDIEAGELLPDFVDEISAKMNKASEQIRKAHSESDSDSGAE